MTGPLGLDPTQIQEAWALQVRRNREQADQFRDVPERPDFYAPVAGGFKSDPRRTDEPALDTLRSLVIPGESWLDIGAGGGRYALPLALAGARVTALDPSSAMLSVLREAAAEYSVSGVETVQQRWPADGVPVADVAFIAHVSYDIEELGPFLDAMEAHARRLCVAVLLARAPSAAAEPFWPPVHGVVRNPLPALTEFLTLLLARGKIFSVWLGERAAVAYPSPEAALGFLRQQLFIEPGGEKDARLVAAMDRAPRTADGRLMLTTEPTPLGVVTWKP
ncbi:MAG: class I SAM-dependent methyltransferase [Dehalococcoidia bacterium]|nr:class I SAM-dependent methyltransferase [Dehalococcoidia bacterium]